MISKTQTPTNGPTCTPKSRIGWRAMPMVSWMSITPPWSRPILLDARPANTMLNVSEFFPNDCR